jgi:hypothetical protein
VGDVTHIRPAIKGKGMVFTECKKRNRPLDHLTDAAIGFSSTFGLKHSQQLWVAVIAFGCIKKRLDESLRGIFGRRRIQVHSECRKYFCGVSFEFAKLLI